MEIRHDLQQRHRGAHEERVQDRTENAEERYLSHLLNVATIADLASTLAVRSLGALQAIALLRIVRIVLCVADCLAVQRAVKRIVVAVSAEARRFACHLWKR